MVKYDYRDIINFILSEFPKLGDKEVAKPMENYMKNHFIFLGIKMPPRKEFIKQNREILKSLQSEDLMPFMHELWQAPYREYQYLAMDISKRYLKYISTNDIPQIEHLITHKSWWDTVDYLAVNLLGAALKSDKELQYSYSDQLINAKNMWLRRSALLFQLKYKEETDFDLLQAHILHTSHESEFFIRKAAGWALREYSKTNPLVVRNFIDNYRSQLSNLTIREGSKYI